MLGSYGPFEAMLGLGTKGTAEFAGLFTPWVWFVLSLFKALGRPLIRIVVAADGGTVVGTTMVLPWPNSGYVLGVGVRPSHRRRGLAVRMLGKAEDLTVERRKTWSVLDVEEENLPAVTLYRSQQYETIQKAEWFRCPAPQAVASAPRLPASSRAVGKAGRGAAAAWCAQRIPPAVTTPMPPDRDRLTHLESLGQFPGARRETWSVGPADSPVGFVSACWRGKAMPGLLFFPALDPSATHDDLARLVQEGTAWLVSRECGVVLAVVPDNAGAVVPVLEELGFSHQLSTLTMVRRLGGGGSAAFLAKGS
jgi:GNAT superfamily N-acetyltransferase